MRDALTRGEVARSALQIGTFCNGSLCRCSRRAGIAQGALYRWRVPWVVPGVGLTAKLQLTGWLWPDRRLGADGKHIVPDTWWGAV
jgi:hypothetical protein